MHGKFSSPLTVYPFIHCIDIIDINVDKPSAIVTMFMKKSYDTLGDTN